MMIILEKQGQKVAQSIESKLYKLEDHVNDWVKSKLDKLKLKNQKDYHTEIGYS